MIIRILGEGQYDVPDQALDELNRLDAELVAAVEAEQEGPFTLALDQLLTAVRGAGSAHDPEAIDASDLILPPADASLDDVRELLSDDGLIPG